MNKLPSENDDKVIELSMKHLIAGFGGLVISLTLAGTSIVLVRDYVKFKRQKYYLKSITEVILFIKGGELCQGKSLATTTE